MSVRLSPVDAGQLAWLVELLGPGRWAVLPSRRRARLLVPLGAPEDIRAALWQFNDGMAQASRLARAFAGVALAAPPAPALLGRRGLAGTDGGGGLLGHLEEALGYGPLAGSVRLGPPRPNRKPVLQLLGPGGARVGYAKVGWNELTRRLVAAEAATLARLATVAPRGFAAPRLLHHGTWEGLEVTVCEALPHALWRRGRRHALPPPAVLREIAALGGTATHPLASSPYWRDLRARLARLAGGPLAGVPATADRLEAEHGSLPLAFGTWHGDLGPWNLRATRERLLVWDWERCAGGRPVGFDALHFLFQVALGKAGIARRVAPALAAARTGLAPLLPALGQPAAAPQVLPTLYLLERIRRATEAGPPGEFAAALSRSLP